MSNTSQFDASASMLGYIYQIRFALYLSLKKLSDLADPEQLNVSIEKLDDIAFDSDGSPEELLQTKFHGDEGNITDRSSDIWKTIRVWVESIESGEISLGNVILSLVTTQAVAEDSLASLLGVGPKRNIDEALEIMSGICEESNQTNEKGYKAFKSLSVAERKSLLSAIYVVGRSEDLLKIRENMKPIARQSVPVQAIDAFLNRIEGNWFKWVVEALSKTPSTVINLGVLQELVENIRPEYALTNLPAEYVDALPDAMDVDNDMRVFVKQMRLFNAPKKLIELAITNYYRAFEQRNKWAGDGLLNPGEISGFDRKLFEKWYEQQAFMEIQEALDTEEAKRAYSAKLYQYCQQQGIVPIRPDFVEEYLSKGSYHMLSDDLKIGWHPEFEQLGNASNEGVA
ncbi:ABC-three component system protein [Agaribacterium haliotis]|uniref:ABC-three component system protein n=1 Tax=Agaribacterium haliotis TaxID=2013869 RepID=UPI0011784D87|nr:ABC-three component system protein [Agaribacterium haliotis]